MNLFLFLVLFGGANAYPDSHPGLQSGGYAPFWFSSNYELATEPLTTDLLWKLDPQQPNPHRQRWALNRSVEMAGLKSVLSPLQNPKEKTPVPQYRVTVEGLISQVHGYTRPPGPWYRPWSEFSCEKDVNSWFETLEGAKYSAAEAGKIWSDLLNQQLLQLSVFLGRISAPTADLALSSARLVFKDWLSHIEKQWRAQAHEKARMAAWNYYQAEAKTMGLCSKKTGVPAHPSWATLMEPLPTNLLRDPHLLARAPARLWNGLFTLRVGIKVGDRTLNGRFLIDSSAAFSVISPSWLEGQGIYRAWVEIPKADPRRVTWSSSLRGGGGLARPALVDQVNISGFPIPLREFLIAETEFFGPPENVGYCCDGVLGLDFLQLFPIEFQTQSPSEVRIWPRENFHLSAETPWIEVSQTWTSQTSEKHLESSCTTMSEDGNSSRPPFYPVGSVTWNMGSEHPLELGSFFNQASKNGKNRSWKVQCDSMIFAEKIPGRLGSGLGGAAPRASIGMPLLSRGNFTLDLGHGRIWFSKEFLDTKKIRENETGLKLHYVTMDGERALVVKSIQKSSAAFDLQRQGLSAGVEITQIDGKDPDTVDLWEVERRLAGEFGDWVSLQWKTSGGLKIAPLRVRGKSP